MGKYYILNYVILTYTLNCILKFNFAMSCHVLKKGYTGIGGNMGVFDNLTIVILAMISGVALPAPDTPSNRIRGAKDV